MVSTRGTDLSVLTLETEMNGAWLLGTPMHRNSLLRATLGTRFGGAVVEGSLALVALPMGLDTCETEMIVSDQFEDLRRTQLAGAEGFGEGEMVVLKSHDCTQGAGLRRTNLLEVGRTRRLRFGFGLFLSNYIDPYIQWGEVEVVEKMSGPIILL